VGDDELEEHLRPVRAVDLARPPGQPPAAHAIEEVAAVERPVGDDGDAALGGEREQPPLGVAVGEAVGELHEVERFAAHRPLELRVATSVRSSEADVTNPALLLPFLQRAQVHRPVDEVVDLHQVEALDAPQLARAFHLPDAGAAADDPDLGGRKHLAASPQFREQLADHRLRRAVHRRRIDEGPAAVEERAQHRCERGAPLRVASSVKGQPGADADHRQPLAGGRDRPRDRQRRLRAAGGRPERRQGTERSQQAAAVHVHGSGGLEFWPGPRTQATTC
jgi:hypothetical protein